MVLENRENFSPNKLLSCPPIMSRVKVNFGTAKWGSLPIETSQDYMDILERHNVKHLDTAHIYVKYDVVVEWILADLDPLDRPGVKRLWESLAHFRTSLFTAKRQVSVEVH